MNRLALASVLSLIALPLLYAEKPATPGEFFPMSAGTYWVYKGTVRWDDPESDKPGSAEVTWKMTVERVIQRKGVVAAVVSGFPGDLDWSAGTTEPKPWLFIEDEKHRVFYENLGPNFELSELNGDDHVFDKFMVDDNFFFQWPVHQGAKFCDEDAKKREDGYYCWVVAEITEKKLQPAVSGAPADEQPVFRMEYWTLPDDQKIELVPGLGVLSYRYHHHGTLADTDLRLVEFHPAPQRSGGQGPKP
jgi:hypothetical protein